MDKKELRKAYLEKRKRMPPEERALKSRLIANLFFEQIYSEQYENIHLFLPIMKFHEIDTWVIVDELTRQKSPSKIVISRSDTGSGLMTNYYYNPAERLVENKWGIPEQETGELCDTMKIDMVLIPLLVFDRKGHRAGYGKGFYDRFLKECRHDALKVGLSFEPPVDEIDDAAGHDIRLDLAITPDEIYYFNL